MADLAAMPRIAPLEPPYEPAIEALLEKWMPPGSSIEPLALFRTLAVHDELFARMRPLGAGILGHGRIEPQEREIVIHRACARAGAEYEWGVHVIAFGKPLGLTDDADRRDVERLVRGPGVVTGRAAPGPPRGRASRHVHGQLVAVVRACRALRGRSAP